MFYPLKYERRLGIPTFNAQQNLMGRTHYVDPENLRFHKSRILSTHVTDGGLLFSLIESVGLDMDNTRRGFRYVVFDIFGTIISRVGLEECYRTRAQASKAMWAYLNTVDAKAITRDAADRCRDQFNRSIAELLAKDIARA